MSLLIEGWKIEESSTVPRSTRRESIPMSMSRDEAVVSSWSKHNRSGEIELLNRSTGIPREDVLGLEDVES